MRLSVLASQSKMATVVKLLRQVSSFPRYFRGVARSPVSWRNGSDVKKWKSRIGVLAVTSITLLIGYKYSKLNVVHALKSRRVCKYSYFLSYLQLSCTIVCGSLMKTDCQPSIQITSQSSEINDTHNRLGCSYIFRHQHDILSHFSMTVLTLTTNDTE